MTSVTGLRIGELARRTACRAETIRYYERERLLPSPPRTPKNYRTYGQAHVARLSFIRHCRALDMTLGEIRALLKYYDSPRAKCGGVNDVIDSHIVQVAHRIRELQKLKRDLTSLRRLCAKPRRAADCEMLQLLAATEDSTER